MEIWQCWSNGRSRNGFPGGIYISFAPKLNIKWLCTIKAEIRPSSDYVNGIRARSWVMPSSNQCSIVQKMPPLGRHRWHYHLRFVCSRVWPAPLLRGPGENPEKSLYSSLSLSPIKFSRFSRSLTEFPPSSLVGAGSFQFLNSSNSLRDFN